MLYINEVVSKLFILNRLYDFSIISFYLYCQYQRCSWYSYNFFRSIHSTTVEIQQGEKSTFTLIKINKSTEASKIYKYIKYKFNVTWLINSLYILTLLYEDFMFTSQYWNFIWIIILSILFLNTTQLGYEYSLRMTSDLVSFNLNGVTKVQITERERESTYMYD